MRKVKSILGEYKTGIMILSIGILVILILPWILTHNSWILDFTQTGQIGDTVGGITAPINGLLGAILIYITRLYIERKINKKNDSPCSYINSRSVKSNRIKSSI